MNEENGEFREVALPEHLVPAHQIQKQPSKFSCLPTAFAIIMGIPVTNIIDGIGHDDARGFHVQECLSFALMVGWAFSPHELEPMVEPAKCRNERCLGGHVGYRGNGSRIECKECCGDGVWRLAPKVTEFSTLLANHHGVLTGKLKHIEGYHAVAWDRKVRKCLDPRGIVIGLELFEPDAFWLAVKMKEDET